MTESETRGTFAQLKRQFALRTVYTSLVFTLFITLLNNNNNDYVCLPYLPLTYTLTLENCTRFAVYFLCTSRACYNNIVIKPWWWIGIYIGILYTPTAMRSYSEHSCKYLHFKIVFQNIDCMYYVYIQQIAISTYTNLKSILFAICIKLQTQILGYRYHFIFLISLVDYFPLEV